MSVLETLAESGSPALKAVDLKVTELESKVESNTQALEQQAKSLSDMGKDVKNISDELATMNASLSTIKAIPKYLKFFFLGFVALSLVQDGGTAGLITLAKLFGLM